ncbi:GNAT family N-acetyltransferase [Allomeiothermus silvanus]|uniref:GNAT family N-acetyltransferase n=1 Tax=Allomeiothermus silvanus TaxID=52022 RepID=UPI00019E8A37|nr:GNAT family protein [Allomeiothermus silvanus]
MNSFDPAPFAGAEEKVRQHGLEITTLAELAALEPETYQRKFYDLWCEVREDVPRPEPATPVSFEEFHKWIFESPRLLPEGTFVAVDPRTGAYVGLSQLWKPAGGEHLETGLTGVRRAYRRKGLALAMKLRAAEYAKHVGAPEIRTGNESNNRPMLAINEALGFKKQPAWIDFVKVLK